MRIVKIAAVIAMWAMAAIACGQGGMPASSLSKSPGTAPTRVGTQFYKLPPGAYVMAYSGQQMDATVTTQAQSITVSFGGQSYTGSIAANTNHFASTQLVMGHAALDGNLTADGVMSGRYLSLDPRGAPRPPAGFTLTSKDAGATISSSSGQKGIPAGTASQQALNPPPLPPPASAVIKPGDANSLNPQPLPPKPAPDWGNRPGERNSLNPQPLPPEPNWGTKQNAPLPPQSSAGAITNTGVAGPAATRPIHVGEAAAKRFRAVGLDPASSAFATQVRERVAHANAAALKAAAARLPHDPTTFPPKVIPANAQSAPVLRPRVPKVGSGLEITEVQYFTGVELADLKPSFADGIPLPAILVVKFKLPTYAVDAIRATHPSSLRIAIPDCGIDYTHSVVVDDATSIANYGRLPVASQGEHFVVANLSFVGGWPVLFPTENWNTYGQWFSWPGIGMGPHPGRLVLTSDGSSDEYDLAFRGAKAEGFLQFGFVDAEPPFLAVSPILPSQQLILDPSLGVFANPGAARVNYSDQPMEGEDVIGAGALLGPGWRVLSAQVYMAWSMTEALPGGGPPDNPQRGAAVVESPSPGHLDTRVKWHIAPGESLSYLIEWVSAGQMGQRELLSTPRLGPCDQ